MPSTASPFGLRPVKHGRGGTIRPYARTIAAAYGTALYAGAPVKLNTSGTIELAAAGNDEFILGVFSGVEYTEATGHRKVTNVWPGAQTGATDIIAYVVEDPDVIYEIQSDEAIAITNIGHQANLVNPGNGSTVTGLSTAALDGSTAAAANRQLSILDIAPGVDNEAGDAFTNVLVTIAQHQFRSRPAGF